MSRSSHLVLEPPSAEQLQRALRLRAAHPSRPLVFLQHGFWRGVLGEGGLSVTHAPRHGEWHLPNVFLPQGERAQELFAEAIFSELAALTLFEARDELLDDLGFTLHLEP
jgi:hypothetical protein